MFDYAPFFQGRVVDFIHFDIWHGRLPSSLPLIGDVNLSLFPIFNVADIGIVGGVIGILVFQKKFLAGVAAEQPSEETVNPETLSSPIQESRPVTE